MALYVGGPCDGLPIPDGFTEPRVCGGATYTLGADGNYHPESVGGGATGTVALGSHGPKGWADLQRAINRTIPLAHARTTAVHRATAQRLRRQSRRV